MTSKRPITLPECLGEFLFPFYFHLLTPILSHIFFNIEIESFMNILSFSQCYAYTQNRFLSPVGDFPRPNKLTKFTIRKDIKFQKILGVGGAFTDATGINIATLSKGAQENLIK